MPASPPGPGPSGAASAREGRLWLDWTVGSVPGVLGPPPPPQRFTHSQSRCQASAHADGFTLMASRVPLGHRQMLLITDLSFLVSS